MENRKEKYIGYIITNSVNGKEYVGITSSSIGCRWSQHLSETKRNNLDSRSYLHKAINKYGENFFSIEEKIRKGTWEEVCSWEKETIKERNSKAPNGYNLTDGGEGALGAIRTSEFKKKLSKAKKDFYSDPKKREEQSIREKELRKDPKFRKEQSERSKNLWKNTIYREKTIKGNKKRWEDPNMRRKHYIGLKKATTDNPEWLKKMQVKNKVQANDPEWRAKVRAGIQKIALTEEFKKKKSENAKTYWEEGHPERRKKHAEEMSKMINEKLKNPEYQKWRKENPPGAKPILYQFKYFRSLAEAAQYFHICYQKVDRDILKQKEGCLRLDVTKKEEFPYEIKY